MIVERLVAIRTREKCSQDEFARRLGLNPRTYAGYERGERDPSLELLSALHREYKVDPAWLLNGPGDEPVYMDQRIDVGLVARAEDEIRKRLRKVALKLTRQELYDLITAAYQVLRQPNLDHEAEIDAFFADSDDQ